MNIARMLLVLMLLTAAIAGCVMVYFMLQPAVVEAEKVAPPATVGMLVAAREINAGTLMKDGDLAVRQMPQTDLPEGAILDNEAARAELRGALLRRYAERNRPFTRDDVLRLHDRGFLAAVLTPGSRAISIGVDVVTGASGLIWPGDRVDVILVQDLEAGASGATKRVSGETILMAVRVIAVDQQLSFAAPGAGPGGGSEGKVARTVALEVSPAQAERLAVAERLGRVALTVRAIEPAEFDDDKRSPVYGSDVSAALLPKVAAAPRSMRVFQGADMQEVTFR